MQLPGIEVAKCMVRVLHRDVAPRTRRPTCLEVFSILPFDQHVLLTDRFHVADAFWPEPDQFEKTRAQSRAALSLQVLFQYFCSRLNRQLQ